jgi:hypothetical protein
MAKKPELTPDEKYALKYLKELQKKGKPGDVQKRLDRLDPGSKATIASAIKKSQPASRAAKVNKPAKQATPAEIKVRNKRTGKLVSFKTESTPRGGRPGLRGMLGGGGGLGRANR